MWKPREFKCDDKDLMTTVIETFKQEKPRKKVFGNFRIEHDKLIYRTERKATYNNRYEAEILENVIAFKTNGLLLGNASILPLIGAYTSYGNETLNHQQTKIQELIEADSAFDFIPFNVFHEAKLDLSTFEIIDKGEPEQVVRQLRNPEWSDYAFREAERNGGEYDTPKWLNETVHFLGSRLFKCGDSFFLFDIDRGEIEHKIFNPFLVKLPLAVESIVEAYEVLKPLNVSQAESQGLNVKRQGEWFFIPVDESPERELTSAEKHDVAMNTLINNSFGGAKTQAKEMLGEAEFERLEKIDIPIPLRITLQAGRNRPNNAQYGIKKGEQTFVKGTISHSGREHKDLELTNWHEAVCNTAMDSFTILGDVD